MKLIEEWRQAWRWFSVQAMALVAALQGGWAALPEDLKNRIPARGITLLSLAILLLGIGGRLISQKKRPR